MVFTGTRADFGLLRPVLEAISATDGLEVVLVAGGTHFSAAYGRTIDEIVKSGFEVAWSVDVDVSAASDRQIAEATAATLASVAEAIESFSPDVGLVLGDRYEALAFATACLLSRVPLAHIHGGETTEGAIDDAIRNAMTQMADVHFVAAIPFAERVISMGADPESVYVVGAPGLDTVRCVLESTTDPLPVVEQITGALDNAGPVFLVSFHPESRSQEESGDVMQRLLTVLLAYEDSVLLISAPNADWGRNEIVDVVESARSADPERIRVVASFGHRPYVAAMMAADVVVGNSSSGIIEVPFTGTASVNIGNRQLGRPLAASVFQSSTASTEIAAAVDAALGWVKVGGDSFSLYGDGRAGPLIAQHLLEYLSR